MTFYLQFIVLMLALFYGTSIVSEEVENKTLTYLTTRPLAKPAILLGKYGAYTARSIVLVVAGVVASFLILNFDHLNDGDAWLILLKSLIVLVLALIAYTAFFTFLGHSSRNPCCLGFSSASDGRTSSSTSRARPRD